MYLTQMSIGVLLIFLYLIKGSLDSELFKKYLYPQPVLNNTINKINNLRNRFIIIYYLLHVKRLNCFLTYLYYINYVSKYQLHYLDLKLELLIKVLYYVEP